MSKLSRFLFFKWLKLFFYIFIAMFFIGCLGDFISFALKDKVTTSEMFSNLFFKTNIVIEKVLPISCLFSSMFLFVNLKNHSELTALLSSSFNKRRIAHVLFLGGLITFSIQLLNRGYYEAYLFDLNQQREKKASFKFKRKISKDGTIWFKGKDYFGSFLFFDETKNVIVKPTLYLTNKNVVEKVIQGESATIDESNTWNFKNVEIFNQLSTPTFPQSQKLETYSTSLDRSISDFKKYQAGIYSLGLVSLRQFIGKLRDAGVNVRTYFVLYYEKIASSIACLLFTIFPIFSIHQVGKRNSSLSGGLFLTLLFTLSFWFVSGALISIGNNYMINPLISVFSLHVLMTFFCLYHYFKLEKLQ